MLRRIMLRIFLSSIAVGAATPVYAGLVTGVVGKVAVVVSYSDYGNGDVIFEVQTPLPTCQNGFWLRPSDPGFKTIYAQLLMAHAAGLQIKVYAFDDQIWAGSTGRYCRIYFFGTVN